MLQESASCSWVLRMVGETSHFQVPYSSPDGKQHLDLDCLDSEFERSNAVCTGTYQTAELSRAEVSYRITLGAASGPGCLTDIHGPEVSDTPNEVLYEYVHPKNAAKGPECFRIGLKTYFPVFVS